MQLHRCFVWFVVRNNVNRQIKTSCEGSRMWRLKSMFLRRFFKTIQSEENSFHVPRSFQTKERSKTGEKHKILHRKGCLGRHLHLAMHHLWTRQCCCCLRHYLRPYRWHLRLVAGRNCLQLVFPSWFGAKSPIFFF